MFSVARVWQEMRSNISDVAFINRENNTFRRVAAEVDTVKANPKAR